MVRSTFLFARLRSAGGVYLSGGLKPATETSRILTYPPLTEAGVFPTEINNFLRRASEHGRYFIFLKPMASKLYYTAFSTLEIARYLVIWILSYTIYRKQL
jgi:hypothetical protein